MLPGSKRSRGLLERQSKPGVQYAGKESTGMVMMSCYNTQAGGPWLEWLQKYSYLQVSHGAFAKMIIQYLYPQLLAL